MLYIFLVDTGTMLTFEMNLAMQRVRDLQDVIARECRIPQEKQVLLISGGDSLDPSERVCRYAAGTDSNPIFLFNKQSLESASPPSSSTEHGLEIHLRERVEDSLTLTASYETLAARAGLAANFHDVARDDLQICQRLVFDQHLQHQGWLAVIANLEDVTHAFEANNKLFFRQFDEFLSQREENLKLLDCFPAAIELLAKIPLLQSLETFSLASITSSEPDDRPKTLLEWITAQETNKTLEQMMLKCRSDLEQFEEPVGKNLTLETESILSQVDNVAMKEVRGLEGRLFQLDFFMQAAAKLVAEQEQIFKSIENNQVTAIHVQDLTVLPELCEIHRHQMPQLLRNHEQLQDIKSKCRCAKVDLSENLHKRLRWVMYVEKGLTEMNNRIFFYKEMLHRLKHHLEIIRQISSSSEAYCRSVVEVVRRRRFSEEFTAFAKNLSEKCSELRRDEITRRKEFDKFFHRHFLNALFPGLDDIPPSFATKCPDLFDNRLPSLTEQDISYLIDRVPQLIDVLRLFDRSSLSVADLLPYRTNIVPVDDSVSKQPLTSSMATGDDRVPEPTLDVSSQSVEIITKEESQLATIDAETLALPVDGTSDLAVRESRGRVSPTGSMGASPELEDNPANDTFMTADFYIDESMPSSMTELASSKKLAELQCILQDKTSQLEQKEREVSDGKRCIEELTTKLLVYEKTTRLMNDAVLSCCAPLKQDLEDVKTTVAVNRSLSLAELDTVHSSLTELVKTWNVTSEQMALDSARNFDESLTAVREKLDAESESVRSCTSENRKLQELLDEKSTDFRVLSDKVEKLKEENDGYRKTLLELELENEKLQTDYKTDSEAKDDLIRSLRQTADEITLRVKAKDDELGELAKNFESEKLLMRAELESERAANEARVGEEIMRRLSEKHEQELSEIRKEILRQLEEEKESSRNAYSNYAEKEKRSYEEFTENMTKLQNNYEAQLKELTEKYEVSAKERDDFKLQIDELVVEKRQQLLNIDELNRAIEETTAKLFESENRIICERESQTDIVLTLDAESQIDKTEERITSDVLLQTETVGQDAGTQTEDEAVEVDPVEIIVKSTEAIDTQTDALSMQNVEIQAVSVTTDVEIQNDPAAGNAEVQTDAFSSNLENAEVQTDVFSSHFVNAEVQTGAFSSDPTPGENIHADSLALHLCEDEAHIVESRGAHSQCENAEEMFETGVCELRSCSEPPALVQSESDYGLALQLRIDDYLPFQRHDEIVTQLKARLEEEKTAAVLNAIDEQRRLNDDLREELLKKFEEEKLLLKANLEEKRQIIFNEALNRAVAERDAQVYELQKKIDELSAAKPECSSLGGGAMSSIQEISGSRFVQGKLEEELAEAKQEILRLQSHLRLQGGSSSASAMGRSFMGQSFVPLAEASSLISQDKIVPYFPIPTKRDLDKFKETLIDFAISSSVTDLLMRFVSISRCREQDVVFFVWNPDLGHYLAYLIGNHIQHFLHVDSASHIEQQSSEFKELHKWLVGEVINHELCLAKKETNRFKVPIGTKFFRVKAKPWLPSTTSSSSQQSRKSSSHDEPPRQKKDADTPLGQN